MEINDKEIQEIGYNNYIRSIISSNIEKRK